MVLLLDTQQPCHSLNVGKGRSDDDNSVHLVFFVGEYDNCVDKRDGLNCDMVVRFNMCEDIKHHRDCCQSCRHVLLGKR